MRVHLATDHAGMELSAHLLSHLTAAGYDVVDHGPSSYDPEDDYPSFCIDAAQAVIADRAAGTEALGIVLGGSGNGEQMAASKVVGVRAALCYNDELAQLSREHNNAQLIGIGGRMHTEEEALKIVDAFVAQPWSEEERHQRRIDILAKYEETGVAPEVPGNPAQS